ncbi:hypothetical protein L1987_55743 [Smallanthus sonchifolius]|uniref:Uncharacterized protein n=1 Tax=Smallanthus sonchifolius TaxID=185202 RepID=A0ACB9EA86_9ASTR|nr:hypothetical protein L1987_55743 [Smallanthus sonchifolius]
MNASKHLVFFIISTFSFILHPSTAFPRSITFEFPPFPLQNISLLGDSYSRNGTPTLTLDSDFPFSSSGTIIYNTPIRFSDNRTNSTTSFSTKFSFSIVNLNPLSTTGGGGLSFFISPDNHTLGSPGGYLGLVNSSQLTQNKFIAIEFDTRRDPHFNDPNENHLGLDIDSLNSIATADCISVGIDLRTGVSFTSWIDYNHDQKNLKVFLSRSIFKPESPILNTTVDLSVHFQELMYVGFSASTEGRQETHSIHNWSFKSFGIKRFNPRIDNTVPIRSPDVSRYNNRRNKIGFGLEVTGSVFIFTGLVVFGYISVKKWRETKTEMKIKAEVTKRPREFSYKELKLATNNFHSTRIIGHGSFGTVYKAFLLSSGTTAAVKRSLRSREAKTEFFAELSAIAGLRHKNLVQLLGCYGVVVLEVCCGRRPIEREVGGASMVSLVDWVWDLYANDEVLGAIDKRLNGEFDEEEGKRLLMVGLSCVNPRSEMRPSMRRVLQVLNHEVEDLVVPAVKPKVSFSSGMPLSVDDLVRCSENGEHELEDDEYDCGFQIHIDRFED